jgi:hypothetical protein
VRSSILQVGSEVRNQAARRVSRDDHPLAVEHWRLGKTIPGVEDIVESRNNREDGTERMKCVMEFVTV